MFFVTGALGGCILSALSGMDWAASDTQTRIMVTIGVIVSFSSVMGAFIDSSFKAAKDGNDPITGLPFSRPPFATQEQVDAGTSKTTVVSPSTLAHKDEETKP